MLHVGFCLFSLLLLSQVNRLFVSASTFQGWNCPPFLKMTTGSSTRTIASPMVMQQAAVATLQITICHAKWLPVPRANSLLLHRGIEINLPWHATTIYLSTYFRYSRHLDREWKLASATARRQELERDMRERALVKKNRRCRALTISHKKQRWLIEAEYCWNNEG